MFYYDAASGEYVGAVEIYDESSFTNTANGGNGTSFYAKPVGDLSDAVSAVIGGGGSVTSNKNIEVISNDHLETLIISGTVAVGGGAGVGVGLTVGVLNSNVQARVDEGTTLIAGGNINVNAATGASKASGPVQKSADSVSPLTQDQINSSNAKANEDSKGNGGDSSVRLISVTAAGSVAGIGVSGAVLTVFSNVNAKMVGNVNGTSRLNVTSGMNFGKVLTANLAAAGGTAVNAGVVLALNRSEAGSIIGKNVQIDSETAAVSVGHSFSSDAIAIPISLSMAAGVSVNAMVTVAVNSLNAVSYIGAAEGDSQGNGRIEAASLAVSAIANGDVDVTGVAVSGGLLASVNGIVAIGLNFVKNVAAVRKMPINLTGGMNVSAKMTGVTDVTSSSITVGGVAVGASIDAAYIGSTNEAIVELGGESTASSMSILAQNNPRATVIGITGGAGGTAVNVNLGLALNKGVNRAVLGGSGSLILSGEGDNDGLFVQAHGGMGQAHTALYSAGIGGVAVNVSLAFSWLKATQEAKIDNTGKITVENSKTVKVEAIQGTPTTHGNYVFTDKNGGNAQTVKFGDSMAKAYLFSAGAGLVSVNASAGVVISDSTNRAFLKAKDLTAGTVYVTGGGKSDSNVKIDNIGVGVVSVGLMAGVSLTKGTFDAGISATGNWNIFSLILNNSYSSTSVSDVTPAAGGVSASLVNAGVNVGIALNATKATTTLNGGGRVNVEAVVNITANSTYDPDNPNASAIITKPSVDVSLVKVVANVAVAQNRTSQTLTMNNISILGGTANMTVSSTLINAGAKAETKLSGGSGASISIVGIDLNFAVATSKTVNTASISGGAINVKSLSMNTTTKSQVNAFGKTPTAVGLVLVGALLTDARTADQVSATVSNANITTENDVEITAVGDGTADALSENGMKVSLVSGTSSRASAQVGAGSGNRQSVTAGISGGSVKAGTSLTVSAENTGHAILSEIGSDMSVFPTAKNLVSWAGCCPRNDKSAKHVKSTRIAAAGSYLKPLLVQVANALLKSKQHPEFTERYRRIKSHRGHKKALIALCKMLLTAIWNILSSGEVYNTSGYILQTSRPAPEKKVLTQKQAFELLRLRGFVIKDDPAVLASA